jgi:Protein of unknown function (DUF295)
MSCLVYADSLLLASFSNSGIFGAMEAEKALERDWSSLPPELLNLIAKDLSDISDFVRFRAVCAAWRFSTPASDLPAQFPWIYKIYGGLFEPFLMFYSMLLNKFYMIPAPKSLDQLLEEPYDGYFHINFFYEVIINGMLFTVDRSTGVTKVTDTTTGALAYVVPPVQGHLRVQCFHFLEAFGDTLGIFGCYNDSEDLLYEVHHLVLNESGSPSWVKVKTIGDCAFFIDTCGGFMLKANDLAGIKANCIYYLNEIEILGGERLYDSEMVRIDIETGAHEHRRCPAAYYRNTVGWFIPNLFKLNDSCNLDINVNFFVSSG